MPGFTEPPAAVAPDYTPPPASFPRSTRAEGAGARAILLEPMEHLFPVEGIDQVDGYQLMQSAMTGDTVWGAVNFYARGGEGDWFLDVSQYAMNFQWTQARFAWFVRHGFPLRERTTPWFSEQIDRRIALGFVAGEA